MKGTHLARVARANGAGFGVPLEGVRLEAIHLDAPETIALEVETAFLVLEGEAVLDLPGDFVHLRPGEIVTIRPGAAVRLAPVGVVVLARISGAA